LDRELCGIRKKKKGPGISPQRRNKIQKDKPLKKGEPAKNRTKVGEGKSSWYGKGSEVRKTGLRHEIVPIAGKFRIGGNWSSGTMSSTPSSGEADISINKQRMKERGGNPAQWGN